MLINPSKNDNNVQSKADFMITVTWPDEIDNDVDTYVRDPQGNLVAFMRREEGLMHLDRDDLGNSNDTLTLTDGRVIKSEQNQEIVTIRGWIPGEWVVNIHFYAYRPGMASNSQATSSSEDEIRIPITVELIRINPYKSKGVAKFDLVKTGQEKTAFNFTVMERTYSVKQSDGTVVQTSEYWMDEITTMMTPFIYEHKLGNTYQSPEQTVVEGTGPGSTNEVDPIAPYGGGNP